jgi:hypothetical protein
MTANEYTASKMGGYDWRGRGDQARRHIDEFNKMEAIKADTATEPSLRWRGDNPNQVMYNPGGGTNWSPLSGEGLTDPTVIGMLRTGAAGSGANAGAYKNILSKVSPATMQGIEGSSHSLAPDVLNKMWR